MPERSGPPRPASLSKSIACCATRRLAGGWAWPAARSWTDEARPVSRRGCDTSPRSWREGFGMSRSPGAVLFDLDDTLYPQRRFVFSGFAAVARHLEHATGEDRKRVFLVLRDAWRERRGRELQACVERFAL